MSSKAKKVREPGPEEQEIINRIRLQQADELLSRLQGHSRLRTETDHSSSLDQGRSYREYQNNLRFNFILIIGMILVMVIAILTTLLI